MLFLLNSNGKRHWILHGEKRMMIWSCCWPTSEYEDYYYYYNYYHHNLWTTTSYIIDVISSKLKTERKRMDMYLDCIVAKKQSSSSSWWLCSVTESGSTYCNRCYHSVICSSVWPSTYDTLKLSILHYVYITSICMSSLTLVHPATAIGQKEIPFGRYICMTPGNIVLSGSHMWNETEIKLK